MVHFKGPLKCLETYSVILCGDVISTETERQGGTYRKAPPPFKIANSVSFTSVQARALELAKAAFDSHSVNRLLPSFNMKHLLKRNSDHNHAEAV